MTHRETKKEAKRQKNSKPDVVHYEEREKTIPRGVIKGNE